MFERWSLKFPITIGVTMIILIIALIVGWVTLATVSAMQSSQAGFYWAALSIGTSFLALVLTGVVFYMTRCTVCYKLSSNFDLGWCSPGFGQRLSSSHQFGESWSDDNQVESGSYGW